ncbi:universal stress protein [Azoarcus sp. DN11]|uniref:universal stress protein n=1 Tax=Azoarcus sp. DN11 TaxID=356837 RepID=UPI000EB3A21F|nr:universal stress protein [Azoarcus sp. DN11]AYH45075.1 sulfate transporter [Azoarcus sp. DN11]
MFRHLLVPTDGSTLSAMAVKKAVAFAQETKARITFFFATPNMESSLYGEVSLMRTLEPDLVDQLVNERARDILEGAESVAKDASVPSASACGVADEPYEGILAAAAQHGCDIILMASHGRKGVKGLLLGSQTQKVLTHSTIPVLVYR